MAKLKGQGALTKWFTSNIASYHKKIFTEYITQNNNLYSLCNSIKSSKEINIEIVSFSSNSDFSEQVLSILTFLKYVGIPISWTIYSDNSHTNEQIALLKSALPFTKLITTDFNNSFPEENIKNTLKPYKNHLFNYANTRPLGKKLFLYLNHFITIPTLFLDSDILFYHRASCLHDVIKEESLGWFLPDAEWGNLDSRYLKTTFPHLYQVNSGLFLASEEFSNVNKGLDFLESMDGVYEYFSEQSILHIILVDNKFNPLDPRYFILNSNDQFDFSYSYNKSGIAARHYTGPVRHKMWQRDWKWHLSL